MIRYINFNGNLQNEEIPIAHTWNRSFRYGDGFFETIAVTKNSIPFLRLHFERLTKAARFFSMRFPENFSDKFLEKMIFELCEKNKFLNGSAVRVTFFRRGKGKYLPENFDANFVIEAEGHQDEFFKLNEKGIHTDLFHDAQKTKNELSNYKTCSAAVYVLAAIYKKNKDLDDCFLLNTDGNICDAISSNVFAVKGKQIFTPPLSEGCVDGVMRKVILSLAFENKLPLEQAEISPEFLFHADEIFLTNAITGIRWVRSFHDKIFTNEVSRLLSEKLNVLFEKDLRV